MKQIIGNYKTIKLSSIFLLLLIFSCSKEPITIIDDKPKEDPIAKICKLPSEVDLYNKAQLKIKDNVVPLLNVKVNNTHAYKYPTPSRIDSGLGRVYIKGKIEFTIELNYEINKDTIIYPSQYNVDSKENYSNNSIRFTISNPGKYVIEPNGDSDNAIQLYCYKYDEEEYKYLDFNNYNLIEFKSGLFSKDYNNDNKIIDNNNYINVNNNTIIYIHDDAVVRARISCINKRNIYLIGNGIIDGSNFNRENTIVPINFEKCEDIKIDGINVIDPAAWTCNFYFTNNSTINNLNIISSRANGDGITLQSCKKITANDCYIRGFDDNLVVKNYSYPYGNSDRNTHGISEDIKFTNCVLWTDLAQSMEIGYETVGEYIKNIEFNNIVVVHDFHKPIISIHNSNYADIYNINFKNITVEMASMGLGDAGYNNQLIEFTSKYSSNFSNNPAGGETEVGNIHDVNVDNVVVNSIRNNLNIAFNFEGQKDTRSNFNGIISNVSDVEIKDVKVLNKKINNNYSYISKNQYANNINFIDSLIDNSGAVLDKTFSDEYLNSLSDKLIIK